MVTLPEAIPEPLPDAEGISQYNMAGGLFRDRGMGLLMLRSGAGVRRTRQKDEGQMRETIRKKVMADKQEYIPRQVKHAPLYELEHVDDLGMFSEMSFFILRYWYMTEKSRYGTWR